MFSLQNLQQKKRVGQKLYQMIYFLSYSVRKKFFSDNKIYMSDCQSSTPSLKQIYPNVIWWLEVTQRFCLKEIHLEFEEN